MQNIVLIGFMGCGKTTVGRLAAQKLGWPFVDTDQMIAVQAGRTIPEIFQAEGEAGFRRRETAVLEGLESRRAQVVATGGGIVTQPRNVPLLRQLGFVVWLNAGEDVIYERVMRNRNRPLVQTANPQETIRELLAARRPLYAQAAHFTIETAGLAVEEVAYGVCESARHYFGTAMA